MAARTAFGVVPDIAGVAKHQAQVVLGKAVEVLRRRERPQSLTIAGGLDAAKEFFRDPARLSEVLGDIAEVKQTGAGRFRWEFSGGPASGAGWDSVLVEDDRRMRFADVDTSRSRSEIVLDFASAPNDMGTEVTLRIKGPMPSLLSGALAFKALYRARALLQAGELPTIRHNPSARRSAR
ncbi:hypothetical protein EHH44_00760 [Mycolicibacter terrae]|uniref:Uncharacterized protein n=2 Tax=Mycolicibacter TaxID=1073531 RepID=A0A1A2NTC5_MYCSD|nr:MULTISPECIES: hypothetical protein [Mycolicibacter]OBH18337.1 hypothetical protein A5694_21700 [Mycolicibacter sinensis]OBI30981.1 hypothetical protein A5710_19575 [Mycolicibacter sinensis]RRR48603.1 hypothetical protein EHH44_00760 [Mycolicibacter terrae]